MWQSVSVGVLFYVMSLSIGKAGLIVGYGLTGDVEHLRQLILTDVPLLPQRADVFSNIPHRRYLPAAFMGASEKRCMDKPLFLLLF